jgi:hypothetical protein
VKLKQQLTRIFCYSATEIFGFIRHFVSQRKKSQMNPPWRVPTAVFWFMLPFCRSTQSTQKYHYISALISLSFGWGSDDHKMVVGQPFCFKKHFASPS